MFTTPHTITIRSHCFTTTSTTSHTVITRSDAVFPSSLTVTTLDHSIITQFTHVRRTPQHVPTPPHVHTGSPPANTLAPQVCTRPRQVHTVSSQLTQVHTLSAQLQLSTHCHRNVNQMPRSSPHARTTASSPRILTRSPHCSHVAAADRDHTRHYHRSLVRPGWRLASTLAGSEETL
jgi:hypothetical protein